TIAVVASPRAALLRNADRRDLDSALSGMFKHLGLWASLLGGLAGGCASTGESPGQMVDHGGSDKIGSGGSSGTAGASGAGTGGRDQSAMDAAIGSPDASASFDVTASDGDAAATISPAPGSGTWTDLARMPGGGRSDGSGAVVNGLLLVVGGQG